MGSRVMVNGLPGRMARIIVAECRKRGLRIVPFSLTGEGEQVGDPMEDFVLIPPSLREKTITSVLDEHPGMIAVDFTHPDAVNDNAEFYVGYNIPFVMGTTGGDRDRLMKLVNDHCHPCVIAPNMSGPIVAFQAMMEYMKDAFPGVFNGFELSVTESHQSTKVDTSGTAKAVTDSLLRMGAIGGGTEPIIRMVRDESDQLAMGVPKIYLDGHGWHEYTLTNPDSHIELRFVHNICGRGTYVEGTVKAVEFLTKRIAAGTMGPFDMIDVLRDA